MTFTGRENRFVLLSIIPSLRVFTNSFPPEIKEACQLLFGVLERFALICRQHGYNFRGAAISSTVSGATRRLDPSRRRVRLKGTTFQSDGPNQKITAFCRAHGIIGIDPTSVLAKRYSGTGKPMYFPRGDMHWHKKGHWAFIEEPLPAFVNLVQEGFQEVQAHNSAGLPMGKTPGARIESTVKSNLKPKTIFHTQGIIHA